MILAQLGAEVIKVEPPGGDKTRSLGGMGISFFPLFNRGKRSVVLDFAKADGPGDHAPAARQRRRVSGKFSRRASWTSRASAPMSCAKDIRI